MSVRFLIIVSLSLLAGMLRAESVTLSLARALFGEGQFDLAAVEFRRLALDATNDQSRAAAYLAAGYSYLKREDRDLLEKMVEQAEDYDGFAAERIFLNAEAARIDRDGDVALYYYELLAAEAEDLNLKTLAHRRAAIIHAEAGRFDAARRELTADPNHSPVQSEAIDAYVSAPRKRPLVGGLFGLFPGAGYWYSGEVANGFRSLILNAIFMYGMAQTADDNQWGAFTVLSFFELTWYSGSIYGGIDAAHRYNQALFDTLRNEIDGDCSYTVEPSTILPLFNLRVSF